MINSVLTDNVRNIYYHFQMSCLCLGHSTHHCSTVGVSPMFPGTAVPPFSAVPLYVTRPDIPQLWVPVSNAAHERPVHLHLSTRLHTCTCVHARSHEQVHLWTRMYTRAWKPMLTSWFRRRPKLHDSLWMVHTTSFIKWSHLLGGQRKRER